MRKQRLNISNSGGYSSGVMTYNILNNYSDEYECVVTFANTGCEHENTRTNHCAQFDMVLRTGSLGFRGEMRSKGTSRPRIWVQKVRSQVAELGREPASCVGVPLTQVRAVV